MAANNFIPFVEKYRPCKFDDIVLNDETRNILQNIIDVGPFPNLLFFGPPGTGKTTTIINIINAYQQKVSGEKNKKLIIHLNASDERGIDIIRTQIAPFVYAKPLFSEGLKFVVLDEVDYMTKTAQQALKQLIQQSSSHVRFCLICNYISKIEEGLQNEFIRIRFNRVPREDIFRFLQNISEKEELRLPDTFILSIISLFKCDIRLMINFMQMTTDLNNRRIIGDELWELCISRLSAKEIPLEKVVEQFIEHTINYNIDQVAFVISLSTYFIKKYSSCITHAFLNFIQNIIHSPVYNHRNYFRYFISTWRQCIIARKAVL